MRSCIPPLFLFVLIGCVSSNDYKSELKNITITTDTKVDVVNSEEIFKNGQELVILEVPENEYIIEVSKLLATSKGYFAINYTDFPNVIHWDTNGKFLLSIDYKFYPEEWFHGLSDIYFDDGSNSLYLLHTKRREILVFNIDTKNLSTIKIPYEHFKFTKYNDDWIFFNGNRVYDLENPKKFSNISISSDLVEFDSNLPFSEHYGEFVYEDFANFFPSNEELIFSHFLNDTIYSYSNGGFYPKYVVDFGRNKIPDDLLVKNLSNPFTLGKIFNNPEFIAGFNVVFNNKEMMIISFNSKRKQNFLFYDKIKEEYYWTPNFINTKYGFRFNRAFDSKLNTIYFIIENEFAVRDLEELRDNLQKKSKLDKVKKVNSLLQVIGERNFVLFIGKL